LFYKKIAQTENAASRCAETPPLSHLGGGGGVILGLTDGIREYPFLGPPFSFPTGIGYAELHAKMYTVCELRMMEKNISGAKNIVKRIDGKSYTLERSSRQDCLTAGNGV
jgi:hypothetical protein